MKNKTKKGIIMLMFILQILVAFSVGVSAETTVEISPEHPKPQDTVVFNTTITNVENIKKAVIIVKECGNEPGYGYICYTDGFNETMTAINNDIYTAQVKLNHKNAVELKYQIGYLTNKGWMWEPSTGMTTVELDVSSSAENNEKSTPGFELVLLLASIISGVLLFRRKRK